MTGEWMTDRPSTRERLLEAAIRAIDEHGEAAVRVTDISEEAGVTRPSLYHFFGSRDGLVIAAQAERYRRALSFPNATLFAYLGTAATREEYIGALDRVLRSFGDEAGVARRRVRREVMGAAVFRPELARLLDEIIREQVRELVAALTTGKGSEWVTGPYDMDVVILWWLGIIQSREFIDQSDDPRVSTQWDDLVSRTVIRAAFGADAAGDPGPTFTL